MSLKQLSTHQIVFTCFRLLIALFFLSSVVWPLSPLCSGRPLGYDCESWLIFGVNLFAPFGVLALGCAIWGLFTRSAGPNIVLALGFMALTAAWLVLV